ncbi:roadblock/LC7 domain-containing protein [uncultured Thiothrix sp.]|jgi:predicted regulator of Ras-like GTPase activity (Roadblock/LC7/MglB family)|uniref:roadblock/LC7 domain-containing protein n=1 Tax=uncultured Thiothrix sp. TaxID=223185 RepID=UPI002608D2A1|nr:roadblock/LC7 domain-containing protein [uncultured Thiothrix sp.]HMT92212.1 roadblock/LC7 domain-containing protein [Thiolinea sp.]
MLNQQYLSAFAQHLQANLPDIQAMQILTTEGLTLLSAVNKADEDQISALSAMLLSGASQLTKSLGSNRRTQGLIVCYEPSAYVVTAMNEDCMLGLQIPAEMGQPSLLTKVSLLISDHASTLKITH